MQNNVIKLISETRTVDSYGDTVAVESAKEVFAEVKSVGMKEKYEALSIGLNPELTFIIADYYDYDDQAEIEFENKRYRVLRTYRTGNALEITVTRVNADYSLTTTASISS